MWILILPWVECLLVVVMLISLDKRWWKFSVLLAIIVVGLNFYGEVFSIARIGCWSSEVNANIVKVMTWNINGMEYDSLRIEGIAKVIKDEKPDFMFLQESFVAVSDSFYKRLERFTHIHSIGRWVCTIVPIANSPLIALHS